MGKCTNVGVMGDVNVDKRLMGSSLRMMIPGTIINQNTSSLNESRFLFLAVARLTSHAFNFLCTSNAASCRGRVVRIE